jgi:cytochrome c-type biogenesis protein CcmE
MKYKNIIIFITALILLGTAVFFLSGDVLSPYVSFKEAKSHAAKYVQVIGTLDKSIPVVHREGEFSFTLIDKDKSKMQAVHRGIKPQNFEHTEQVVLLGRYNARDDIFVAENILVKCPSKYRRKK